MYLADFGAREEMFDLLVLQGRGLGERIAD
jgi:hypothetical protein